MKYFLLLHISQSILLISKSKQGMHIAHVHKLFMFLLIISLQVQTFYTGYAVFFSQ